MKLELFRKLVKNCVGSDGNEVALRAVIRINFSNYGKSKMKGAF